MKIELHHPAFDIHSPSLNINLEYMMNELNAVFSRCTWQHLHHRLHIQPGNPEDFTWLVCNVWRLAAPDIRRVFITDPRSLAVLGFDPHAPQQKERGAAIAALEAALG